MRALTTQQIKAARMLLGWDQIQLAVESGLSQVTIKRIEACPGPVQTTEKTQAKIREALERAGIVFLFPTRTAGVGVRLSA